MKDAKASVGPTEQNAPRGPVPTGSEGKSGSVPSKAEAAQTSVGAMELRHNDLWAARKALMRGSKDIVPPCACFARPRRDTLTGHECGTLSGGLCEDAVWHVAQAIAKASADGMRHETRNMSVEELGRLVQKAHAYWVSIGAPGAEE